MAHGGVLLIDWENLAGAVVSRGGRVTSALIEKTWEFGQGFSGGELQKKHIAAANFDEVIRRAVEAKLIRVEPVRGEKEQADIALTVLAMDYLHEGYRTFVIVTGDQDFVPLIQRLHSDGCRIAVILGNSRRINSSLDEILRLPGIEKHDIVDLLGGLPSHPKLTQNAKLRTLLGLFLLQADGIPLGGKDTHGRTERLRSWGFQEVASDDDYWSLVTSLCVQVDQHRSAVRVEGKWTAQRRKRTRIALDNAVVSNIHALDHLVRKIGRRNRSVRLDELRTGPFKLDDGAKLTGAVEALRSVGMVAKHGDGSLTLVQPEHSWGWIEPLWRVYSCVASESARIKSTSIPMHSLESIMARGGVGSGTDSRAAGRVRRAIDFAKAYGAIDFVCDSGTRRYEANSGDKLCAGISVAYHRLRDLVGPGKSIDVRQAISAMAAADAGMESPIFGWDDSDRHRIVRILQQSRALRRDGEKISMPVLEAF